MYVYITHLLINIYAYNILHISELYLGDKKIRKKWEHIGRYPNMIRFIWEYKYLFYKTIDYRLYILLY